VIIAKNVKKAIGSNLKTQFATHLLSLAVLSWKMMKTPVLNAVPNTSTTMANARPTPPSSSVPLTNQTVMSAALVQKVTIITKMTNCARSLQMDLLTVLGSTLTAPVLIAMKVTSLQMKVFALPSHPKSQTACIIPKTESAENVNLYSG
jgi:hypothetical protein